MQLQKTVDLDEGEDASTGNVNFSPRNRVNSTNAVTLPDQFPEMVFDKCRQEVNYRLGTFWQLSEPNGKISDGLESELITPIYNRGEKG